MAGIDDVLERLVADEQFRQELAADPAAALAGYQLTREDLELLASQFDDSPDAERSVEQRTSKSAMVALLGSLGGGGGKGGASPSADHKGWIDLQSMGTGADRSVHQPGGGMTGQSRGAADLVDGVGTGSTRHRGQANVEDLTVSKEIDKSSPMLAKEIDKSSPGLASDRWIDKSSPDLGRELDKSSTKAADGYMKLGDIEGESARTKGETTLGDVVVTRELDKSSTKAAGGYVKIGDIKGETTDEAAQGYIKIGDIEGESLDKSSGKVEAKWKVEEGEGIAAGGDEVPIEDVSLNYNKITIEYDDAGSRGPGDGREESMDDFFDVEDA